MKKWIWGICAVVIVALCVVMLIGNEDKDSGDGNPANSDQETLDSENSQMNSAELGDSAEKDDCTEDSDFSTMDESAEDTPTESQKPDDGKGDVDTEPTESEKPSTSETESQKPSGGNDNPKDEPTEPEKPTYTYKDFNKTMYVTSGVNVRDLPSSDGAKLGKIAKDTEVTVTGQCNETGWYRIEYKNGVGYVSNNYLTTEEPKVEEPDTGSEDSGNTKPGKDPADANGDGFVSPDEGMSYITPEKQACIDAGYGVVVEMNGGEWYAVLTPGNGYVNEKSGFDILREYLKERNLEAGNLSGAWINPQHDWYWFVAEDIHKIYTPDDSEYWEDVEIEL